MVQSLRGACLYGACIYYYYWVFTTIASLLLCHHKNLKFRPSCSYLSSMKNKTLAGKRGGDWQHFTLKYPLSSFFLSSSSFSILLYMVSFSFTLQIIHNPYGIEIVLYFYKLLFCDYSMSIFLSL